MPTDRYKGDEDRPRRGGRDGEGRPRRRERDAYDDDGPPRRRTDNEGAGSLGAGTAMGGILTALFVLLLLVRFIRIGDMFDRSRREQRDREEVAQRAVPAPPEQKI